MLWWECACVTVEMSGLSLLLCIQGNRLPSLNHKNTLCSRASANATPLGGSVSSLPSHTVLIITRLSSLVHSLRLDHDVVWVDASRLGDVVITVLGALFS